MIVKLRFWNTIYRNGINNNNNKLKKMGFHATRFIMQILHITVDLSVIADESAGHSVDG